MKLTQNDCLSILRRFGQASDENVPREIERLSIARPSEISTLATFRLGKRSFALLFDDTLEDRESEIEGLIRQVHPNAHISLVANPREANATYGMPFEGKDCYLAVLDDNKQRLDVYLATNRPEYSRSSWQKYIKAGYVSVNGTTQKTPKVEVDGSEGIAVSLPDAPNHDDKTLPILYIDDDVIVINKPTGVLTHHKNQLDTEFTVADFFRRYTTHDLDADRPGIVHRLDRDTSGVMIGARHSAAYDHLKEQFAERLAHKTYEAVVDGVPSEPELLIDLPIMRNPAAPGSFKVDPRGKPAQTRLEILQTNGSHTLVRLQPRTGRTHQLRVHLAHIRTPIHGDRLYGRAADRLYLHATELTLILPNGDEHTFSTPRPASFDTLAS